MTTLDVQRTTLLDDAQSILTRAKNANRELTDSERKTVRSNLDDAARLLSQIQSGCWTTCPTTARSGASRPVVPRQRSPRR